MDIKELVQKNLPGIKKLLKFEEVEEVKSEDVKSADGTVLRITPNVEVGAQVEVIGEDGELTAPADGNLELEDGTLITVEGGVIVEVQAVEGEEAPEEMNEVDELEPTPEAPAFDLEKLQKQIINKLNVAITEKIEKLRFATVETVDELTKENKELKEGLALVVEIVEKFAETPSDKPKKTLNNPFANKKTNDVDLTALARKIIFKK